MMRALDRYMSALVKLGQHEFSSVMVELPEAVEVALAAMRQSIKESDQPESPERAHVTILYGLHGADPKPIETLLANEGPVRLRLGRTNFFPASESSEGRDVVYVEVYGQDLRHLHRKLRRHLPHTVNWPRYVPHLTVAYVKKGSGHRYVGRTDLDYKVVLLREAVFSTPGGKRTRISLVGESKAAADSSFSWEVPALLAGGALAGGLAGRYLVEPILRRVLGLDPKRSRNTLTAIGALAGLVPGIELGAVRSRLRGGFFAPSVRDPETDAYYDFLWNTREPEGGVRGRVPRPELDEYAIQPWSPDTTAVKRSASDPYVYDRGLWDPSFPVMQNLEAIRSDPNIPLMQRVKMQQLVAEAGRQQGVGATGMASAGALISALPRVVLNAAPAVGGAWAASELLGAPPRLRNSAIGSALVYSALKSFMES